MRTSAGVRFAYSRRVRKRTAPTVGSLVAGVLAAVVAGWRAVSSALESPEKTSEMVLGLTLGLVLCVAVAVWVVVRTWWERRAAARALRRARFGSPQWRCLPGPSFPVAAAPLLSRPLPRRLFLAVEMTFVEAPDGLELWRGDPSPLVRVPWQDIESIDVESLGRSGVLVVRTRAGHRVPVVLCRDRDGGLAGASWQTTGTHAAHLARRYGVRR